VVADRDAIDLLSCRRAKGSVRGRAGGGEDRPTGDGNPVSTCVYYDTPSLSLFLFVPELQYLRATTVTALEIIIIIIRYTTATAIIIL
jgi:hypothetical protein